MRTNPAPTIATPGEAELTLHGLGVSVGIAIGPAHLIESGWEPVPEYTVSDDEVEVQQNRLNDAVGRARNQLTRLKAKSTKLPSAAAEEIGFLLDAHLAILSGSRLIRGADRRIAEERVNAEWAIQAELGSAGAHGGHGGGHGDAAGHDGHDGAEGAPHDPHAPALSVSAKPPRFASASL